MSAFSRGAGGARQVCKTPADFGAGADEARQMVVQMRHQGHTMHLCSHVGRE
jgi:hypothetical protein